MLKPVLYLATLLSISNPTFNSGEYSAEKIADDEVTEDRLLSTKSFSLENRYGNSFVNSVFKDNILLTLSYMSGEINDKSDIDWDKVRLKKRLAFSLKPGETFAFHDQILPQYKNRPVKTTNAHFNFQDGFKSDGYLVGDGICHLASIVYWTAKDAGLETLAPVNHDFAEINEVPKEYGVSIYYLPGGFAKSSKENLYITNNTDKTIVFLFDYDGTNLNVKILKNSS